MAARFACFVLCTVSFGLNHSLIITLFHLFLHVELGVKLQDSGTTYQRLGTMYQDFEIQRAVFVAGIDLLKLLSPSGPNATC